jgi:hypothetical protein
MTHTASVFDKNAHNTFISNTNHRFPVDIVRFCRHCRNFNEFTDKFLLKYPTIMPLGVLSLIHVFVLSQVKVPHVNLHQHLQAVAPGAKDPLQAMYPPEAPAAGQKIRGKKGIN